MASSDRTNDGDLGEVIDILLVEPNHGDVRLFEESFKEGKIVNAIHTVSDGEAALDFVHQCGDYDDAPAPDLILLEPQLPGTTGMEVLSELNDEPALNEIPVAVLTSSELGADIVKSHGLEAEAYIRKPVEADEFVEFVHSIEEFWFAIVKDEPDD
ncbi:response regulator [Natrinema salaciae]|uniref:Response regulator receiver domain-containing protein n=1 Tax=Natrinema salaciae TaxID=1186196 RepID=A0A1H9CFY5_9EURY|nr:response regulator [Natrinema salaciae]SEP99927.1 Response regulator receiver domain-containing protein [Natrinema salaciae]